MRRRPVAMALCAGMLVLSVGPTAGSAAPGRPPNAPKATAAGGSPAVRPSGNRPTGGAGPDGSMVVTGTSTVALTFDDGPDPNLTPRILDLLKQYGVQATFCVVGFRARDHPELIRRIAAEGHTLCNHSWQHLMNLAARPVDYIHWDLTETNKIIHEAAPDAQIRYFRAPGGNFTPGLVQLAREYGMSPLFWDVDTRDWDSVRFGTGAAMVDHVVSTVQRQTRPGSIVLAHDNGKPDTIAAYGELLPWLTARFNLAALPTH